MRVLLGSLAVATLISLWAAGVALLWVKVFDWYVRRG